MAVIIQAVSPLFGVGVGRRLARSADAARKTDQRLPRLPERQSA